jgi:AmmeMemoRadiSam system protein B/AmmeMemoRadiSam system protein A
MGMKILRLCLILFIIGLGFAVACQANKMSHTDVREPVLAGKFYPSSAPKLKLAIEKFMEDAVPLTIEKPVAIVVPHAGYVFSGQICADGFTQARKEQYDVVVILGTNHTNPGFAKISVYPGGGFRTPLGTALVDRDAVSSLIAEDPVDCTLDKSLHEHEHSVEVIVPFVQVVFPKAKIVPVIIGSPDLPMSSRFGQALAKVLKNKRALVIASSDLSHYPNAKIAAPVDKGTLEAITTMNPAIFQSTVKSHMDRRIPQLSTSACGEAPIIAAMAAAKALGATRGVVVSYANSGDIAIGEQSRVVGYGAVAFTAHEPGKDISSSDQSAPVSVAGSLRSSDKRALLAFARKTISRIILTDTVPLARGFDPHLQQPQGVFVTLKRKGELRGCIGRIVGDEPLCKLVGTMAIQAALNDRRFPPLTADELNEIDIEISVLTPLKDVSGATDIVAGRDGIVLNKGGRSAVFLPQVALEQGWTRQELLNNLCLKAGLNAECWLKGAQLSTFQATVFSEAEFK